MNLFKKKNYFNMFCLECCGILVIFFLNKFWFSDIILMLVEVCCGYREREVGERYRWVKVS